MPQKSVTAVVWLRLLVLLLLAVVLLLLALVHGPTDLVADQCTAGAADCSTFQSAAALVTDDGTETGSSESAHSGAHLGIRSRGA